MTMMKGMRMMKKGVQGMKMMKPNSSISFRNAYVSASLHNYQDDNPHHGIYKPNMNQTKPFSLILPRNTNSLCGINIPENLESSCVILEPGLVLLKNYVSISDQAEIVNICQEFGIGPGGFYQAIHKNGGKRNCRMMCFGRNWDPITKYDSYYRSDGSHAPPLPDQLISLAISSVQDSQTYDDSLPSMCPDICLVNFYTLTSHLGLHQDRDESPSSLRKGLPVVSISVGDSAKFVYSKVRDEDMANEVLVESGDVLIFGGKSRHIFHAVTKIIPNTAPLSLLQQTMLRPGRLSLTFRQY
ncbi:DNA N(6)-methyladenine demethylase ALKBH1D-like [Rutidosis leptorrhynchoides]|uniref:DNA N(6)-methyladenine demethylase ALKBH1D-like n=1 Tax=Rutidosis leptorrhynchoides TaxID=125765 RepID=UPI003A9A0320